VKNAGALLVLLLATACDEGNSSSVSADYGSVRVKQLALSDEQGKTLVIVTAKPGPSGTPQLVLRDPNGVVLNTIEIGRSQ